MLTGDAATEDMTRAFLTDGERAAVRDSEDMDASTKSSHLSRIRGKFGEMETEARLLRQHRPEMYEQLHEAVVEEALDERIERLEQQVETLQAQLEAEREGEDD